MAMIFSAISKKKILSQINDTAMNLTIDSPNSLQNASIQGSSEEQ